MIEVFRCHVCNTVIREGAFISKCCVDFVIKKNFKCSKPDELKEDIEKTEIQWSNIEDVTELPIDDQATYYDAGGISTMDIIKAKLTEEQFKGFVLGNVIKYSCRLNYKNNSKRDAEKTANYSKILSDIMY